MVLIKVGWVWLLSEDQKEDFLSKEKKKKTKKTKKKKKKKTCT